MSTFILFAGVALLSSPPVRCPAPPACDVKRKVEEAIAKGEGLLNTGGLDVMGELDCLSLGIIHELSDPRDQAFLDALGTVDVAMREWLQTALRRGASFCRNEKLFPKGVSCLEIPSGDIMAKRLFGIFRPTVSSVAYDGPMVMVIYRNMKVLPYGDMFYGCTLWTMPDYSKRNVLSRCVFLCEKGRALEYALPTRNMMIGRLTGVEQEAFLGFVDVGRTWPAVLMYDPRDGRGDCDMLDLYWLDEAQNAFVRKHVIDYQGTLDEYDEAAAVAIYTGDSPFPGPDQPEVATWRIDIRQFVRDDGMENAATRVK